MRNSPTVAKLPHLDKACAARPVRALQPEPGAWMGHSIPGMHCIALQSAEMDRSARYLQRGLPTGTWRKLKRGEREWRSRQNAVVTASKVNFKIVHRQHQPSERKIRRDRRLVHRRHPPRGTGTRRLPVYQPCQQRPARLKPQCRHSPAQRANRSACSHSTVTAQSQHSHSTVPPSARTDQRAASSNAAWTTQHTDTAHRHSTQTQHAQHTDPAHVTVQSLPLSENTDQRATSSGAMRHTARGSRPVKVEASRENRCQSDVEVIAPRRRGTARRWRCSAR